MKYVRVYLFFLRMIFPKVTNHQISGILNLSTVLHTTCHFESAADRCDIKQSPREPRPRMQVLFNELCVCHFCPTSEDDNVSGWLLEAWTTSVLLKLESLQEDSTANYSPLPLIVSMWTRRLGGRTSYPRRWCLWSPVCCRGCTRSWRTRPRCDTLHWCTGWNRIRWYLKHVQTHPWGRGRGIEPNGSFSSFWPSQTVSASFFPWATRLLETKCTTSGNNVTLWLPWCW